MTEFESWIFDLFLTNPLHGFFFGLAVFCFGLMAYIFYTNEPALRHRQKRAVTTTARAHCHIRQQLWRFR